MRSQPETSLSFAHFLPRVTANDCTLSVQTFGRSNWQRRGEKGSIAVRSGSWTLQDNLGYSDTFWGLGYVLMDASELHSVSAKTDTEHSASLGFINPAELTQACKSE